MKKNLGLRLFSAICLMWGGVSMGQVKSSQLQCRTKAKETAKAVYDECLNLAKYDEADNIRKEYKAKLAKLKAFYEQKLKKLNLKAKSEVKNSGQTNEMASVLPQKDPAPTANDSSKSNFVAPAPTNTQDTETTVPATAAVQNLDNTPASESAEPTIRLKPAPSAPQAPTSEPSENLESSPELTI